MIDLFLSLLIFLLFVLAGSLAMCGWYVVTREGRVFGGWSEYWEEKTSDALEVDRDLAEARGMLRWAEKANDPAKMSEFAFKVELSEAMVKNFKKAGLYYKRPEGLVTPLSGCIYCFASFYGSLFFWIGGYVFVYYAEVDFNLSGATVLLWALYLITTSAANGILIKKVL